MFYKFWKKETNISFIDQIKVKRSSRRFKSISLQIKDGKAEVLCPSYTSDKLIKSILKKRKKWIETKILQSRNRRKIILEDNCFFPFMGSKLKIKISTSEKNQVIKKKNNLFLRLKNLEEQKKVFENWLKSESSKYLSNRIEYLSEKTKINFRSLHIRSYKARWGCCNEKSEIFLNWKLIMLPRKIIDYVLVHELAHIIEPNHSKSFWCLVEKYNKDFNESKKWLKINGNEVIRF